MRGAGVTRSRGIGDVRGVGKEERSKTIKVDRKSNGIKELE